MGCRPAEASTWQLSGRLQTRSPRMSPSSLRAEISQSLRNVGAVPQTDFVTYLAPPGMLRLEYLALVEGTARWILGGSFSAWA